MDSVLKLIYPDHYFDAGLKKYFFNGLHPEIIKYIKSKNTDKEQNFNLETELNKLAPPHNNNWICNRFGPLHEYFLRYINNDIDNYITDGNNIDDGTTYLYPIGISHMNIMEKYSVILDDKKITYSIFDVLVPQNILPLVKLGKIKLIIDLVQDPCVSLKHLIDFENLAKEFYGISGENIIFIFGNDVSDHLKREYPNSKLKIKYCMLFLQSQGEAILNFPKPTSLGYISDVVRINDIDSSTIRKKRFLCFNRVPRVTRLMLFHLAIKHDLLKNSYYSFIGNHAMTPEEILASLKNMDIDNEITLDDAIRIKNLIPYQLDTQNLSKNKLLNFVTDNNKKEFYLDSYVHLITETLYVNDLSNEFGKPFFSEKTFRPIQNLQPFIYIGEPFALKLLQELGFKTFSPFIDESYDIETNHFKRMKIIEKELIRLNNMSINQLHDWYHSIVDVLEFNQNHLVSFAKTNPLKKIFDDISKG